MIDYGKFRLSLERLEERYERHRTLDDSHPEWIREAVAESTIQRFETCYDCLWKALRRHLEEALGLPDIPNSPKPVFRIAAENGLSRRRPNIGSTTRKSASEPRTITTAKRRKTASPSWPASSPTPRRFTKP